MQFDDYPDDELQEKDITVVTAVATNEHFTYEYEHLLAVLADPTHEEYEHLTKWIGGPFDPTAFDLALTNARLQTVR